MSMEQRGENKWRFTVTKDGVSHRKTFYGTEKQAIKAHEALRVDVERGMFGANENMRFEDLAQLVLDEYVRKYLRYNTEEMYKIYYNKHILPRFGNMRINKITPLDIQKFANNLSDKYKSRTVTHNLNIVKVTLKKAVEWGILKESPYKFINKPKRENKTHEDILTIEQIKILLDAYAAEDMSVHKVAFYIALGCGLRNSEIRALTTDDIDFKNNTISVNKQNGKYYENGELKTGNVELKTRQSKRKVYAPDFVMVAIKIYLDSKVFIPLTKEIFYNPTINGVVDRHTIAKGFSRILKKNNLPSIRFHDLRHLHATLLINANVNIQSVSKRLGHSMIQTTIGTYVHSIEAVDKEVATSIDYVVKNIVQKQNLPQIYPKANN